MSNIKTILPERFAEEDHPSNPHHSNHVVIHTDGSCIGNPGPGGWAAILQWGSHRREISGRFRETTNNRMELWGAIAALEVLTQPCNIDLYTDSSYVRDGITRWIKGWKKNGWRTANKQPVKNRDLWERLLCALERHQFSQTVTWHWVKGHAGVSLNEEVDQLANHAARSVTINDPVDQG
ncbi:MAG: ribonuclease HI [Synechococcales bacterium]|nr:ribonuclease HI [Cyanobacteria bacterium REEB444]MEB3126181.1 ribonuclease HI [Synechococcales bacterium]